MSPSVALYRYQPNTEFACDGTLNYLVFISIMMILANMAALKDEVGKLINPNTLETVNAELIHHLI